MAATATRHALSLPFRESTGSLVGEEFRYRATLVEYARGIESRRHSAKRPIMFFVTLQVGAGFSAAKGLRSSKYLSRRSRRCNRTRHSLAFSAAWLRFSTCAVCSIESPSTVTEYKNRPQN